MCNNCDFETPNRGSLKNHTVDNHHANKTGSKSQQRKHPLVIKNTLSPLEDIYSSPEKKDLIDFLSTETKPIVTLKIYVAILLDQRPGL